MEKEEKQNEQNIEKNEENEPEKQKQEVQNDNKKEEIPKNIEKLENPHKIEDINMNKNIETQEKKENNNENKKLDNLNDNENKIKENSQIINEKSENNIIESQEKKEINNENKILDNPNNIEINNTNIKNEEIKNENNQKNEIKEECNINDEKPKNFGHSKMKKIYEEIKTEALNKAKEKIEKQKNENKEEDIIDTNNQIKENVYIDLTEDGGIKKKILEEGNGDNPSDGKIVIIQFTSKYNEQIFDESKEDEPFSFVLGENKVIKGWEIALKSMKIGEKSHFIMTSEYTYGDKQVKEWIPPKSILNYEIKLLAIGNNNDSDDCLDNMSYEEKLQWGSLLKKEGVEKFKSNEITHAKECFIKALSFLRKMDPNNEKEKEGVELYLTLLTNICNCYNKEKEYNSIIEIASMGLKIKKLPKLLSFRAIAYAYNEEFDNANDDIQSLANLLLEDNEEDQIKKKNIEEALNYVKCLVEERKKIYLEKNKIFSKAIFRQYLYNNKFIRDKPVIPPKVTNPENPTVFFEIKIGDKNAGIIEFELFKDITPITAENFRCLCVENKEGLTYKGTCLNKIIKNFVIGGGELENGKDKCIYGEYFDDENYIFGHCRRGLLTTENNRIKNTNSSKFLITLNHIPWFDGKHVVFGQIIKGLKIIKEIEELETDNDDKPIVKVVIENCGEIIRNESIKIEEEEKKQIEIQKNDEETKKEQEENNKEAKDKDMEEEIKNHDEQNKNEIRIEEKNMEEEKQIKKEELEKNNGEKNKIDEQAKKEEIENKAKKEEENKSEEKMENKEENKNEEQKIKKEEIINP